MKYERLTIRETFGMPLCVHQVDNDCSRLNCNGCPTIIDRLAELEDKIEAGILIELPCKVGDEVYIIAKRGLDIYDVEKIIVADIWYSETDNRLYPVTADECPMSEIFLTKSEAEARLKELRGEL